MKKIIMAGLLIAAAAGMCAGQTYWKKTYGGAYNDEAYAIAPMPDGNFIVAGNTSSFGKGGDDIYLLKINAGGDTLWTKTYGGAGEDLAAAIIGTQDGNYIIAGGTTKPGATSQDAYLLKIKPNGDTIWTKTYGGANEEYAYAIAPTQDGNLIVLGYTWIPGEAGDSIYLLKIKPNGDTLWTRTFSDPYFNIFSITPISDGNFIIAGNTYSLNTASEDIYLLKITTTGDTLWTKTYGGMNYDYARAITPTPDGNFIVAGYTYSYGNDVSDIYLLKINAGGDTLWTKTYGDTNNRYADAIIPAPNGNFIVAGGSGNDFYLVKIKSNGDKLWTKTYGENGVYSVNDVKQTSDGNFIVTGAIISSVTGDRDIFILSLIDDRYAYKNSLFTFKIPVSGDSLNHGYAPLKVPAGMTISMGGTISWTPTTDSSYMDHVEFLVSDDMGKKDTLTFNIFVNSKDHPITVANLVSSLVNPSKNDLTVHQLSSKEVRFSLPAGTNSLSIYNIHGQLLENISITGNQATWLPRHAAGRYFAKAIWEKREMVKGFVLMK
jgi:hypothetical protein